ncbi:PREDICTED: extracellular matrix protein 2-like isoform X1 [Hipposideros armiger]|uniref:Extracellular matrix protein 2-like isoform X1 n=1 Tax=Hipposideros armiger TaxID=186990 RepID=A0A8B7T2E7_HIPAR|nr:PREDICTED: extracellular matrix protein 2-like isoform X1 [Hipposideros armiger]XP_019519847.1 PREDICTED: extracellular matrix protein 2-like isoform X1 [Hipposideros armiger]
MKSMLLPVLALWVGCCPGGALAKQGPSLREPTAPPTPLGLPILQPPPLPSPPGTPNGQVQPISRSGGRDRPEDRQLDWPQARPTSKESGHGPLTQPLVPGWKDPARPGLAQRKESPPAAWEQEQSHSKGLSPEQAPAQATATVGVEAARPWAAKFRPLQTSRAPRAKEGAVATEEGQGRKAGGWDAKRKGLKPRKPPKGASRQPGPGGWHQKKAHSRDRSGSSTLETTGRGQKRPGSGRGYRRGPADLGIMEQAMPSLPASCLLAQAAIACSNVKMKHVPALTDPGLTTLYLAENEIAKIPAHTFLGLPNLEWLDLSKNKLDARGLHPHAFKNLTRLKRLNLDGNSLSTVPALPTSLQELKLNDNLLQGLQHSSFRGLSQLLTLEVEGNQLHDGNIFPLAFQPLRNLLYLRLDRNRLRTIPPGLPASLQELHLSANVIEEVTEGALNRSRSLSVLVLSNNRLQEDRLAPRAWIDLPKLETLDLSHNRLVHVPSFLPRGLRRLTLHHNRIERIPGYVFAHMKPGLEFLHLSHNSLRADGIHGVSFLGLQSSLAELLLDHNQLQAIPHGLLGLKGLQVLRLSHNKIRHVPLNSICDTRVTQDSNLISTHLENNLIDRRRIPPTAFSCIRAYHSVVLQPQQGEEEGS